VLLQFGNEAQKKEHLPRIIRGEVRWCQGYSEPAAGSDLASLQTKAVLSEDGTTYTVNGQKIWTSHADKADWMFCLVRTGGIMDAAGVASTKKHDGISFLLIDMQSPGISVRPIQLISGSSPFCETFFDDVQVPAGNLVGKSGGGWTIAKALLEHERELISQMRERAAAIEEPLESLAKRYVGEDLKALDPALRDRITQANMDDLCSKLTLRRSAEAAKVGRAPGPETSMFKLYGTELSKRRREIKIGILGFAGLGWSGDDFAADELAITRDWLRSRASSIEGGSSEIQLNIIAKRVLGLPD
jgi:alkylation response protein AidB-like acyl-CoA dehydrogenase